jgi:hypothetical protein
MKDPDEIFLLIAFMLPAILLFVVMFVAIIINCL